MARSGASRLRELGVLAVQVGNTTAISLQSRTGNSCSSVDRCGTRRQQTLNATRTNIAQYLGADISTFPTVVGSGNATENDTQESSIHHQNVMAVDSMPTGVTKDQNTYLVAESSPHIVNLLQHDVLNRSICLASTMPVSSASEVRPRKRARRRTPSAATEVSVPLSMFGTADCTDNVYSLQQSSRYVDSSTSITPSPSMPPEQFKIPESRRRKVCSSRKSAVAKSQQLAATEQALSNNLPGSLNTGISECSKPSEAVMFHGTSSYNMGDGYQMNGVSQYYRIPVMSAGWQTYATQSVPSNNLYKCLPANAAYRYPHEYGQPRFRYGSVDYPQVTANANARLRGVDSRHNFTPGSSVVFVPDANQMHLKEQQAPSVLAAQTLRWSSATESKSASVPYRTNNSSFVPSVHGVYNVVHDNSGQPMSHLVPWQFVTSRSDALPISVASKPCTETVGSATEKMVQLSVSSDVDRIKSMPDSDAPSISSLSGGHVNMSSSIRYQHVNGLFADVHSSSLTLRAHNAHVKMNGDVDCLQLTNSQAPSKCAAVFVKSTAVTVPPYAAIASSVPTCIGDTNCVSERLLQQPLVQLPIKRQCGLASSEDTELNCCSDGTASNAPKLSLSSGIINELRVLFKKLVE